MNNILTFSLFFVVFFASDLQAQQSEDKGPEIFSYEDGDTTYVMQKYFLCLLKTGPVREQDEETAAKIQKEHRAHLNWLAESEQICLAGPSQDHEEVQGFVLYRVATIEKAIELANMDPAVKAGRLIVDVIPWWAAQGSKLY